MKAQIAALLLAASLALPSAFAERLDYGRFGRVDIARPDDGAPPRSVAILIYGAGGPQGAEAELTRRLAGAGALVLGVSGERLLAAAKPDTAAGCAYLAWDFEALSKYVQKQLGLADYHAPVAVGYGEGAAIAYAAEAQAPINTFRGLIGLGFDPGWTSPYALCGGDLGEVAVKRPDGRGWRLLPKPEVRGPWRVLQGSADPYVGADAVRAFVERVPGGEMLEIDGEGHAFADPGRWGEVFDAAYAELAGTGSGAHPAAVADLPLVELPVPPGQARGDLLAVILSGDGGWADLDRELGETLQAQGIPVLGFNTLKYLWKKRSPDEAGHALERMLGHYLKVWGRGRVLLIGYSYGADILPFMANRLPPALHAKLALSVLLSPSRTVEFEFHPWDWISDDDDSRDPDALPVAPELAAWKAGPLLCVYGEDEADDSLCPTVVGLAGVRVVREPGGHHFDGDYAKLAARILARADGSEP